DAIQWMAPRTFEGVTMSAVTQSNLASVSSRPRISANTRRQRTWGIVFLLPWLIGFFGYQLLPILFTIFLSFTNYSGAREFKPGNFDLVGVQNYTDRKSTRLN